MARAVAPLHRHRFGQQASSHSVRWASSRRATGIGSTVSRVWKKPSLPATLERDEVHRASQQRILLVHALANLMLL